MAAVHMTAASLVDEQDDELPEVQLNLGSAQLDEERGEEEERQSHSTATPSSSTPPSSTPADGETGAAARSSVPVTRKDSSDKKSVRFAGKQGAMPMDASMLKRAAVLEPEEQERVLAGTSQLVNAAQLQRMLQLLQKLNLSKDEIDMLSLDELQVRAAATPARWALYSC